MRTRHALIGSPSISTSRLTGIVSQSICLESLINILQQVPTENEGDALVFRLDLLIAAMSSEATSFA